MLKLSEVYQVSPSSSPTLRTAAILRLAWDGGGLRIFDHDRDWEEVFRDESYGGDIYGVTFADDGRLATSSTDGKIRLYDASFAPVASVVRQNGQS